jgi:hypothetical protein
MSSPPNPRPTVRQRECTVRGVRAFAFSPTLPSPAQLCLPCPAQHAQLCPAQPWLDMPTHPCLAQACHAQPCPALPAQPCLALPSSAQHAQLPSPTPTPCTAVLYLSGQDAVPPLLVGQQRGQVLGGTRVRHLRALQTAHSARSTPQEEGGAWPEGAPTRAWPHACTGLQTRSTHTTHPHAAHTRSTHTMHPHAAHTRSTHTTHTHAACTRSMHTQLTYTAHK